MTEFTGSIEDAVRLPLHSTDKTIYDFFFVLIFSTILTIIADLFCRVLVLSRTMILGVQYSDVRLVVLRITLSFSCVGVNVLSRFVNPGYLEESFSMPHFIMSLAMIPFVISILHLTKRVRGVLKWIIPVPFSYILLLFSYWTVYLRHFLHT